MKCFTRALASALLLASAASAQPVIRNILNSASYAVPPLPGSSIARGSLFVLFGQNVGPQSLVQANFPLPTELAGTSVRISATGTDVSAFMVYTVAGQLAAILPSNTPMGNAQARVTFNGQQSATFAFTVVDSSPGIYTLNGSGFGPAVLTTPDFKVITFNYAAVAGDALSAWITGVTGLTGRSDNVAAEFFDPAVNVEVLVGGRRANVRYRGRAPGLAGVDQVVFDVPADLRGCAVPLAIRVGTNISNFATLPIAGANRLCSDPNGLSEAETARALENGLRVGSMSFVRNRTKATASGFTIESRADAGAAAFLGFDANAFIRSSSVATPNGVSIGYCTVTTFGGEAAPGDPVVSQFLNAGTPISIAGAAGTRQMNRDQERGYSAVFGTSTVIIGGPPIPPTGTPFLDPGTYTVSGPGGPDVGAFNARFTVPQPLGHNLDSIASVSRGGTLTVTWTNPNSAEYVTVAGTSSRRNPTVTGQFICTERASAGRLVVPPEILLALPPTDVIQGTPIGSLSVSTLPLDPVRFTASGLDLGFILYISSDAKNIAFQ